MQAIILAAGKGSRFGGIPKFILGKDGLDKPILHKHLQCLSGIKKITKITVVTGYYDTETKVALKKYSAESWYDDSKITTVYNEKYDTAKNLVSLMAGISKKEDILFMDADIYYDERILVDYVKNGYKNSVLVGNGDIDDFEAVKVTADKNSNILKISKKLPESTTGKFIGEAVGVCKLTKAYASKMVSIAKDPMYDVYEWENFLDDMVSNNTMKIKYHFTYNDTWNEIDTPTDYLMAVKIKRNQEDKSIGTIFLGVDGLDYRYIKENIAELPVFFDLINKGSSGSVSYGTDSNKDWGILYSGLPPAPKKIDRGAFDNEAQEGGLKFNKLGWTAIPKEKLFWNSLSLRNKKTLLINAFATKLMPDSYFFKNVIKAKYGNGKITLEYPGRNKTEIINDSIYSFKTTHMPPFLNDGGKTRITDVPKETILETLAAYDSFDFEERIALSLDGINKTIEEAKKIHGRLDMVHAYIGEIDYAGHFMSYNKDKYLNCFKKLEMFIDKLVKTHNPERLIIVSDHGMDSIKNLKYKTTKKVEEYDAEVISGWANSFLISGEHDIPNAMFLIGKDFKPGLTIPDNKKFYETVNTILK